MLRLTVLLCSGLFLVMLLGGRDFGQQRPGLAQAALQAKVVPVTAAVPVVETADLTPAPVAPTDSEMVATTILPMPIVRAKVAAAPVAAPPVLATAASLPATSPTSVPENTVFTLSNYADPVVDTGQDLPAEPEESGEGEVWYVAGTSLNVRAGPSTNDSVVGKLARGEAALVVWREGDDWARIRIEGDGIEGYVAMRFLTPDMPVVN